MFRKSDKKDDDFSKMKVCPNCENGWTQGDKYCRCCGAKVDKPSEIPTDFMCIYGPPPVNRTHVCGSCGYTWQTCLMLDKERYCPECGGTAKITEEKPLY